VIGFLNGASPAGYADRLRAFRQGLGQTDYVEGRNVVIEYRWADGQSDRLPALAAELVRWQVNVIVSTGGPASAMAAKSATTTIPIVFNIASDPVALGLVASLSRPGGNLTGSTSLVATLGPKRLEILRELIPTATNIGLLVNPPTPGTQDQVRDMQAAARTLGLQIHILDATSAHDFDTVFAALVLGAAGLVIGTCSLTKAYSLPHWGCVTEYRRS
jgi:putative ABC transport system substrate-binding protein